MIECDIDLWYIHVWLNETMLVKSVCLIIDVILISQFDTQAVWPDNLLILY